EPVDCTHWQTDADARRLAHHVFDAGELEPQVAAPHSPANAADARGYEPTPVDVAYIGACTGAKLTDLRMAASVLRGRDVSSDVRLVVAPASRKDQEQAEVEGIMGIFEDAGAELLPNACGICAGYGAGRLEADTTCISSTARNFKGRMGDLTSRVYLASPYTVAASAVAGRIIDPREIMETS
ncbi:MAG: aconitase family protein, partial [Pseudomonadota bacterium]